MYYENITCNLLNRLNAWLKDNNNGFSEFEFHFRAKYSWIGHFGDRLAERSLSCSNECGPVTMSSHVQVIGCVKRKGADSAPSARFCHSLTARGRDVFLFGGAREGVALNDCFVLDIGTNSSETHPAEILIDTLKWREIKLISRFEVPALYGHTCVQVDKIFLIFGGQTRDGSLSSECYKFNPGI